VIRKGAMRTLPLFAVALASLLFACGGGGSSGAGGGGGGAATGCSACKATEACVVNLDKNAVKKGERCVAIPAACGKTASCSDQACEGALYGLCEMGWTGVGCSDTYPPTLVSCNPG
jgi:hypothetical protein